jgi:hypothetical protein
LPVALATAGSAASDAGASTATTATAGLRGVTVSGLRAGFSPVTGLTAALGLPADAGASAPDLTAAFRESFGDSLPSPDLLMPTNMPPTRFWQVFAGNLTF